MSSVCVLKEWEVGAWQDEKERPICRNHFHVRKVEAFRLTGRGDPKECSHLPEAEWVGPRHIRLVTEFRWKIVNRWKFPRLSLVEK